MIFKISDLFDFEPSTTITYNDIKANPGEIPCFTSSPVVQYTNTAVVSGARLYVNGGGKFGVRYYEGDASYSGTVYCLKLKPEYSSRILLRYVYYYLLYNADKLDARYMHGTTLRNLRSSTLKTIQVIIPPMETQRKVVDILELLEEQFINNKQHSSKLLLLSNELRKRQIVNVIDSLDIVESRRLYELTYWNLLFLAVPRCQQPKLNNIKVAEAWRVERIKTEGGDIKLLASGVFEGYTTEELGGQFVFNDEVLTFPTGGKACWEKVKHYKGRFVVGNNHVATIQEDSSCDLKYIYYYIMRNPIIFARLYHGSGLKHISPPHLMNTPIPLPSYEDQRGAIEKIDSVLSLVDELKQNLNRLKELYTISFNYYVNLLLNLGT